MSSYTQKLAPNHTTADSTRLPGRGASVLGESQAAALHTLLPLAEEISLQCRHIAELLQQQKNPLILGEYLTFIPPLMPANDGKIVADHPLSHVTGFFTQQLRFATEDCSANPTDTAGCMLSAHRVDGLVAGFHKMRRFVFQPLMNFHDRLKKSIIPSLQNSLAFGATGANQSLLESAEQIHQAIERLQPLLAQAAPLLDALSATLEPPARQEPQR